MNALLTSLLVCVALGTTTGYWLADEDNQQIDYSDDDDIQNLVDIYKRASNTHTRNLCIPWRAPCTLDDVLLNKYSFLKCCNDGACKCSLWGNNCRCEARLGR